MDFCIRSDAEAEDKIENNLAEIKGRRKGTFLAAGKEDHLVRC